MMFDEPSEYDCKDDKRYGKIGDGIAEIKPETAKKILNAVKRPKIIDTKDYNDIEDEDELAFTLVYDGFIYSIKEDCLLLIFDNEKVDTIEKLEKALKITDNKLFVIPADFHS